MRYDFKEIKPIQDFIKEILKNKHSKFVDLLIILILFTFMQFLITKHGLVPISIQVNPSFKHMWIIVGYLIGFSGIGAMIKLMQFFKIQRKFVDTISKNTIFIIFFHSVVLFCLNSTEYFRIFDYILSPHSRFLFCIFSSSMIIIISYFIILKLQKYFPMALGKYMPQSNNN